MPQKLTTYKNPSIVERAKAGEWDSNELSIVERAKAGEWDSNELWKIIDQLEKANASHKTIKRLRKQVEIVEAEEEKYLQEQAAFEERACVMDGIKISHNNIKT